MSVRDVRPLSWVRRTSCRARPTKMLATLFAGCICVEGSADGQSYDASIAAPDSHLSGTSSGYPSKRTTQSIVFETDEGTFMNVDTSPDGTNLAFDLLGDLYLLPIGGGTPKPVTSGSAWDEAPLFSTDGSELYFISDRQGAKNVWRLDLQDRSLRQISTSESDILGALNWTSDRRRIIAARGNADIGNAEVSLYELDPNSGSMAELQQKDGPWIDMATFKRLRPRFRAFSGTQSTAGTVYFAEASFQSEAEGFAVRLFGLERETGQLERITEKGASYSDYAPQISVDGKLLVFFRQYDDRRTEIRIRNLQTFEERSLVELRFADDAAYGASHSERPRYAFTPDGLHVIYWHAGKIWSTSISNGETRIIPFHLEITREVRSRTVPHGHDPVKNPHATIVRWPTASADGRWLVYSALGYVWIQDLQFDSVRRLTGSTDFEYMPAISPDGGSVVYVEFSADDPDYLSARLLVADRLAGTITELHNEDNGTYLLPRWSPDGTKIALIHEFRTNNSLKAQFGWIASSGGSVNPVAYAPSSNEHSSFSLASRYVGFDSKGEHLVFSYPSSWGEMVLKTADLDGNNAIELAVARGEITGTVPSPNMRSLLLTAHDSSLWLYRREQKPLANRVPIDVSADLERVGSGYYATWTNDYRFIHSAGTTVSFRDSEAVASSASRDIVIEAKCTSTPIAFKGARIVTMSSESGVGPIIENGTLLTRGKHIAEIGPGHAIMVPPDTIVVDAHGMTILPGFIDSHYHRIGGRNGALGVSAFKLPNRKFGDPTAITYGITTAWEPGGVSDDGSPAVADLQKAGRILGPRWSHSASGAVGYPWSRLRSHEDARRAVAMQKKLGATILKEANTPFRKQRQWLSDAAHTAGLGIYSHLQSFDGTMTRLVDGYSGGEHSDFPVPYFKDVAEMLRQSGFVWTPNVLISNGSVSGADGELESSAGTAREVAAPGALRNGIQQQDTNYFNGVRRALTVARQAAAASAYGISVGVSGHNMPGDRLHTEMHYLHQGGMPITEVLRAATVGNATKLGLSEYVGSLESGKIADFLVLQDDPLLDIGNARSIRYTVQGGRVYDSKNRKPIFEADGAPDCVSAMDSRQSF